MSRDMSVAMQAEIAAPFVRPVILVELDFLSAPARLWGGIGPLSWDDKIWTGAGDLLQLDEIEEAGDGTATTMTGTLAGVPSGLTAAIYQDQWQGRTATLWIGLFDEDWTLIADPIQLRTGIMDQMGDTDDGARAIFSLTVSTPALDQGDNRSWRLTDQIQKQFFPDDDIFQYANVLTDKPLRWGAASAPNVIMKSLGSVL